jgi:hypothetical protein
MAEDQEKFAPRRCPRCGGLMVKRGASPYYWHDNNHPRCDITNMVDPPMVVQATDEPLQQSEPPRKNHKNQKK